MSTSFPPLKDNSDMALPPPPLRVQTDKGISPAGFFQGQKIVDETGKELSDDILTF